MKKLLITLLAAFTLFSCTKKTEYNVTPTKTEQTIVIHKTQINGDTINFRNNQTVMYSLLDDSLCWIHFDTTGQIPGTKVILYSFPISGTDLLFPNGVVTTGDLSRIATHGGTMTATIDYEGSGMYFISVINP